MPPRTGVLVTVFNERERIARCLESVRWADELLVVDSGSTDGTPEAARDFGAAVLTRPYRNAADQKNWALRRMSSEWVLVLDADEWLSEPAQHAVREAVEKDRHAGYRIRRVSWFLGRRIRHSGWQRDYPLRLFRRRAGRYQARRVHADVALDGRCGRIHAPVYHQAARSLEEYLPKWLRYVSLAAEDLAERRRVRLWEPFARAFWRFLRQYVLQTGFLDGREGLVLCGLSAASVFLRYLKAAHASRENVSSPA